MPTLINYLSKMKTKPKLWSLDYGIFKLLESNFEMQDNYIHCYINVIDML